MTETDRRRFLQIVGGTAAACVLTAGTVSAETSSRDPGQRDRTRIIPWGTAGGPTILDPARAGTSTAMVYQDQVYLVDLGLGAYQRLVQSGISPEQTSMGETLGAVCGIFFTHVHSDHAADWPALYWTAGSNSVGRTAPPIQVFGPGPRHSLPRVHPPGAAGGRSRRSHTGHRPDDRVPAASVRGRPERPGPGWLGPGTSGRVPDPGHRSFRDLGARSGRETATVERPDPGLAQRGRDGHRHACRPPSHRACVRLPVRHPGRLRGRLR